MRLGRRVPGAAAALLLGVALLAGAPCASAQPAVTGDSLPSVASGHLPGPNELYAGAPRAPQLENTGVWKAQPILVSGAQAYRDGEWIYQDYLYDDHGAAGVPDPNTPYGASGFLFAPPAGTYTYPTDPIYADNAADLVELRVKPLAAATAFRVTLNSLVDPNRTAFTIALGSSDSVRPWPDGAGVSSPAQLFLTVHGSSAELVDAASGTQVGPAPSASVDLARRQVEVVVPHAAWDPGQSKVRMTIGVGLWDPNAGQYLAPSPGAASTDKPGGGSPTGAAIVNAGPRFDEPWPDPSQYGAGVTIGDAAVGAAVQGAWWRERQQADQLRLGDLTPFHAAVDFGKLAAGTNDDSGVPKTGPIDRILASGHEFGQGLDPSKVCFDLASNFSAGSKCIGRFVGQLQPYGLYVPPKPQPKKGWGLTLLLHSLSANYNQYSASNNQSQLGDRGPGSLVITPGGRGPDGFYAGIAEADTFETWADVARHYNLDPGWSAVSGYSMGGFGTYRMLARWPDLFARGFSVVGVPGTADDQLPSLRNTPLLAWNADADELVNITESEAAVKALTDNGLRFTEDLFGASDHLTLASNDQFAPGAEFLGTHRVDRNPMHVSYVVDPTEDSKPAGVFADHAYWLSGLRVRDPNTGPTGSVDARSEAFGTGDPTVQPVQQSAGTLDGGAHGPMPYVQREQDWGPTPQTPKADVLHLKATNLSAATVALTRARLSCAPRLDLETDGPLGLTLLCGEPLRTRHCTSKLRMKLPRVAGQQVLAAKAFRNGRLVKKARGTNLKRLKVRRGPHRRYRLTIELRTSGSNQLAVKRPVARCS